MVVAHSAPVWRSTACEVRGWSSEAVACSDSRSEGDLVRLGMGKEDASAAEKYRGHCRSRSSHECRMQRSYKGGNCETRLTDYAMVYRLNRIDIE